MNKAQTMSKSAAVFNRLAEEYDRWFDSPRGRRIFELELKCLQELMGIPLDGRWLEVGVGTGRFAQALGVQEGVDPSEAVLEYARRRGIEVKPGTGESLPYSDAEFDGVLMVVTLCFLDDPAAAIAECARVLKPKGRLVVGFVPASSPWGKLYQKKAQEGHRFYAHAKFFDPEEVRTLVESAGFSLVDGASTLFDPPETPISTDCVQKGICSEAGFVALLFERK